ncbi:PHP domain-containing protein [Leucobacter sp. cx-328]|uniref:PHP domain-containing protein n=1 Tax=unclassified Leucobacter TaxID=2621730 RepID=UPI00165D3F80|nr:MULTISPECIES: PHP domain-containing protein [unclassified Leucobacter]MBC9944497.1 PHP domain-containing protein [Leucobacter sp. cx-328]
MDRTEKQRGFDLHTHSVFSDGTTRPSEIAADVAALGLSGFALTDHDTIDGWEEAREAAAMHGIDFLPGIEITTKFAGRSPHLLGYGISPDDDELFDALAVVRRARLTRASKMVDLIKKDFAITWEDVLGSEDARTVGRPHIADALVRAGYFVDRSAVFAELLYPGSPYYIGTLAMDTAEAIRLVREAGGVPVIAHPAANRQSEAIPLADLAALAAAGLWGIELDHPENRAEWIPELRVGSAEIGLIPTGSSDFHGAGKPNRLGDFTTPETTVAAIRKMTATPR